MRTNYTSWLKAPFERFVMLKQAGGARFDSSARLLGYFDEYVAQHASEPPLRSENLSEFLASLRVSPRSRDNVIDVVWAALEFARRHDAPIDGIPPRPSRTPMFFRLRPVRLVTEDEIGAILEQARRLPCRRGKYALRPTTYATLFGLLFTTGMRIGEALALDAGDFDPTAGLVTIIRGKFGKSRALPVRKSTTYVLQRYLLEHRRHIPRSASNPLFVSPRGRLSHGAACRTWRSLCEAARVSNPLPRLHDIRHSFAISRVVAWYRSGRDVNRLLPALSTYLGHVSVQSTRAYLQANGSLLQEACRRFALETAPLDEVLS
jgi:integrase